MSAVDALRRSIAHAEEREAEARKAFMTALLAPAGEYDPRAVDTAQERREFATGYAAGLRAALSTVLDHTH